MRFFKGATVKTWRRKFVSFWLHTYLVPLRFYTQGEQVSYKMDGKPYMHDTLRNDIPDNYDIAETCLFW